MLLRCYRRSYSISWAKPTLMDTGSVWELTAYHTTFIWFSNSVNEYTLFDSLWCNNMVICQAVEQTLKFRSLNSVSPHTILKIILGNYWWGKKEICCVITATAGCEWINCFFCYWLTQMEICCVITATAGCEWINCFFLLLAYPDRHVWRAVKQVELLETLQSVLTGYSCYWLQRAGVEAAMPILSGVLRWIEKGKASLLVGINASVLDTINWVSGTISGH